MFSILLVRKFRIFLLKDFKLIFDGFLILKVPGGQPWGPLEAEGRPFFSRSGSWERGRNLQKKTCFFSRSASSERGRHLQNNSLFFSRSGSSERGRHLQNNSFFFAFWEFRARQTPPENLPTTVSRFTKFNNTYGPALWDPSGEK